MSKASSIRIPEEVLTENWYGFMHDLIDEMQRAFLKSGLSQDEIAERLGRDPAFVSRCLRGQSNMTVRTANNIARSMDCRLDVSFLALSELQPSNLQPHVLPQIWEPGRVPKTGTDANQPPPVKLELVDA